MQTYSFRAMGSQILIAMDCDSGIVADAGNKAVQWFEEWEQIFSRFRITSELSEVNLHTGQPWQVSPTFFRMLKIARNTQKKTDGLVTPTVLNSLEEAGYTASFDELPLNIEAELRNGFTQSGSFDDIEMNERDRMIFLPAGLRLDFGGLVKGWAAQQTMLRLSETAPVLVDAGGDIAISGTMADSTLWAVGVASPFEEGKSLDLLMLAGGGIATSGRDYRKWRKGNLWQHHIIDPRTSHPADTDLISATVLAADVLTAEAWAKVAMILGSQAAAQRLDQVDQLSYLLVREDGTTLASREYQQYRWNEKCQILQNNLSV